MNTIHELVYDYLKHQNSPVSFNQVLESAVPKYLNKKELSIVLQELEDENRIVKEKLSNAYHYSLNPEEFDNDYNIYEYLDKDTLNVTFYENKTFENGIYSVGIPDGYSLNVHDKEFVAWLPNDKEPDDCFSGYIIIKQFGFEKFSGDSKKVIKEGITLDIKKALMEQFNEMFEDVHVIDTSNFPFACCVHFYYSRCWHAFVTLFSRGYVSSLRIQMNALTKKDKDLAHKIVLDWVKTIKTENPDYMFKELDDTSYQTMPLNEENITKFQSALIEYKKQLRFLRSSDLTKSVNEIDQDKVSLGTKSLLYDYSKIMASEYLKVLNTVRKVITDNPDNPLIADLYALSITYLNEQEEYDIDNSRFFINIPGIEDIKNSIKTQDFAKAISEYEKLINEDLENDGAFDEPYIEEEYGRGKCRISLVVEPYHEYRYRLLWYSDYGCELYYVNRVNFNEGYFKRLKTGEELLEFCNDYANMAWWGHRVPSGTLRDDFKGDVDKILEIKDIQKEVKRISFQTSMSLQWACPYNFRCIYDFEKKKITDKSYYDFDYIY